MIELPVLIENIIEIVNVAIEMMLVFLYFSLLSKAKVNKAVLYLSYLLSTVILSATVLLTDNILVYLITTIILISSMSFICYDDSIRHKIFWNILFLLIISISEPIVIGLLCIRTGGIPDTLCTCVFSVCGGECGVMGWIKTTKDRHLSRQYELEDRETDKKESMEETENE